MKTSGDLHPAKPKPGFMGAPGDRTIARDRVISTRQSQNQALRGPRVIGKFLQLIRAALREIFDESAYERFLLRTQASRSVATYRAFMQEQEAATVQKPRCC